MLCGSSCVKYIFNSNKLNINNIKPDMYYIIELANEIYNKSNLLISLKYFNSNLMDDYNSKINHKFHVFQIINKLKKNNVNILEEKLSVKNIRKDIVDSQYIIYCVSSAILNNNPNMTGGHFIIAESETNGLVKIINPCKDKYKYTNIDIVELISMCNIMGAWRLLVRKEENNDKINSV